jgi:hypothetical protein
VRLRVGVRPPANAPAGFDGVGSFELHWDADRSHTTQDQAINARLDVRGAGNLPLLRAPAFAPGEFEIFSTNVEDSLPAPGVLGRGRRRFVWTLLPKHAGHLNVAAPAFAWFDPAAARYVTAAPASFELNVLSARAGAEAEDADGLPGVFHAHPAKPGGRAAWPPLAPFGGALVALAAECRPPGPAARSPARVAAHGGPRAGSDSAQRRRGGELLLDAAPRAAWSRCARRLPPRGLEAARTRGGHPPHARERLGTAMPSPPARWLPGFVRAARVARRGGRRAGSAAVGVGPAAGARPPPTSALARAISPRPRRSGRGCGRVAGDLALRHGSRERAVARRRPPPPWTLRGTGRGARPGTPFDALRVRDMGGLVGAPGRALPFRSYEWSLFAFLLAPVRGWRGRGARWRARSSRPRASPGRGGRSRPRGGRARIWPWCGAASRCRRAA